MTGFRHDHMDALNRYREYKLFWDRHRIPGESKDKRMLWTDPGYQPVSVRIRQKKSPARPLTSPKKIRSTSRTRDANVGFDSQKKPPKNGEVKSQDQVHKVAAKVSIPARFERKVSFDVPPKMENALPASTREATNEHASLSNGLAGLVVNEGRRRSSSSSSSCSSNSSDSKLKKT